MKKVDFKKLVYDFMFIVILVLMLFMGFLTLSFMMILGLYISKIALETQPEITLYIIGILFYGGFTYICYLAIKEDLKKRRIKKEKEKE